MAIGEPEIKHTGGESTDSLTGKLNFEQDNNRIIGRDGNSLPRLLILADGNQFVMKVSEDGANVLTASDEDMIFNSGQNVIKVVQGDTVTMNSQTVGAGADVFRSVSVNFPAQTNPPAVLAYGKDTLGSGSFLWSGTKIYTWGTTAGSGITIYEMETLDVNMTTTTAQFTAMYSNGQGISKTAPTYDITYFILTESIT